VCAITAGKRLIQARRWSRNLQTLAVIIVTLESLIFTINYSLCVWAEWRYMAESYVLGQSPIPLMISLYNVTLLFLKGINDVFVDSIFVILII
jgi:hypothetical protein